VTLSLKLDKILLLTGRLVFKNESKMLAVFVRKDNVMLQRGRHKEVLWIKSTAPTSSGFTLFSFLFFFFNRQL